MRRLTFYFDVQSPLAPLPLIRDHNAISVRPEGAGYRDAKHHETEPIASDALAMSSRSVRQYPGGPDGTGPLAE